MKISLIGLILTAAGFILEFFATSLVMGHATDVLFGVVPISPASIFLMLTLMILGSVISALGCFALGISRGKGKASAK